MENSFRAEAKTAGHYKQAGSEYNAGQEPKEASVMNL
jgi:hypothetical protein